MLARLPLAPIRSAYSAAKAALVSLTSNLRVELRAQFPEIQVSTFFPGVVATDFGKSALHGGPDNRTLPMAQPVEEVADALCELIEHPRAEAYSRPMYQQQQAAHYSAEDVATVESKPPFVR
jgi:short-subunit dehydrogenase